MRKSELILLVFFFPIFFLKPLNSPGGIEEFLFAGEERMTVGTDLYVDFFFCTLCFKSGSAGTFNYRIKNFGVNLFFHLNGLQLSIVNEFPKIFNIFYPIPPSPLLSGGLRE